jgi:hypothetical protein
MTLSLSPIRTEDAAMAADREVMVRSSDHIDGDLDILATIHGLSPTGAVREGLTLTFGMFAEFGPDGFVKLEPPHHAVTLSAEPSKVLDDPPNGTTLKVRLNRDDALLVDLLSDRLDLVEQDVIRHAIHVARSLREQSLMGGRLERYGSLGAPR